MKKYYVELRSYDFVDKFYFETEKEALSCADELSKHYSLDEIELGKL